MPFMRCCLAEFGEARADCATDCSIEHRPPHMRRLELKRAESASAVMTALPWLQAPQSIHILWSEDCQRRGPLLLQTSNNTSPRTAGTTRIERRLKL